ncbi:MAG: ROK family protein [bacterium]|nr:ROK family protein [bacterium]MDZ4248136.1 ROK family protein [Patescibacteria group bacterium]
MSEKYIGIDIGGTSARIAEFESLESDKIERRQDFKISGRYEEDLKRLIDSIKKLVGDDKAAGIGLGVAGEHAPDRSRLLHSAHLKDWGEKPIRDDLVSEFDCPVELLNDAEAAAWAEAAFGGHEEDFWFLTWGTGLGGSIVEQRPGGPHVVASEPGHHVICWEESGPLCNCGRRGCFESYVGGAYLERHYGKPPAELSDEEWNEVTDWFARGLYNLVRIYPVGEAVLGGGVTDKQSRHLPEIERKTNEHLKNVGTVKVSKASHGEDAGVVGALASLRQD